MTVCTVYGDLLFLTDFLLDLALLFAVGRFGNFKTRWFFPVAAAAAAGLYSLISILPDFAYLRSPVAKLIFSLLLVKMAFPCIRGKRYFIAFAYFYLLGFVMAGAVICFSWFFRENGWEAANFTYTALALSGALLMALAVSFWSSRYVKKLLRSNELTETVVIHLGGKKAEIPALFDTGNELVDPVTGLPVVIVEFDAVESLLPEDFSLIYRRYIGDGADQVFTALKGNLFSSRLRLIPFSSLGKANGLMLGLRPDKLCFPMREKKEAEDVVICFYRGTLHTRENCHCIVNPAILDLI